MLEADIFKKKEPIAEKLIQYGFQKENNTYTYQTPIMKGQFQARITIKGDQVKGQVIDSDTGEEYVLVHAENQTGNFVGEVRAEYSDLLQDIAKRCFKSVPFFSKQANKIAQLAKDKYAENPDFPFKKFPNYGVFRNRLNNKWYGLVMDITKDKLTKKKADKKVKIEILDLKIDEAEHDQLLKQRGFYPSYHMHRQSWVTIILDGTVADSEIMKLMEVSRQLSIGKNMPVDASSWLIPGNPKYYDIPGNFKVGKTTIWKQSTKINIGDTVYLYVTSPVKAVKYKCTVIQVNIPYKYSDQNMKMQKIMRVKVLKEYPDKFCTFDKLKELGVKAVRGPRRISENLVKYLQ